MIDRAVLIQEIDSLPPGCWDEVLNLVEHLKRNIALPESKLPEAGLGERFAGSMKVSHQRYEEMQQELRAWRAEWN